MIEKGVLPKGTQLTPINPLPKDVLPPADAVRPWNTLNADEKKLFARMAEVYAGFSEYTDLQVGHIIDYLEKSKQLDNTIVFYCADNGASGEGSPSGSVNENKFFNSYPDELSENLKYLDVLGGQDTYNHYPTGWAVAFSTPFQMFKRYSNYAGGTCDPLVISWPKGIKAKGEIRHQYHHSVDIVPTILEICGLEMPKTYRGVEQYPLSGVSMRYSFDAKADGPTQKKRQYYAMLGTRGMWEDGWKAVAVHAPLTGKGNFDKDPWQLYHVDKDRSESKDLAKEHPDKLQALIKTWFKEAETNLVLPLDDRNATELFAIERPIAEPPRENYVYYPGTSPVPEGVAVNTRGRSYKILADVEITDPIAPASFLPTARASAVMRCLSRTRSCITSTTSWASSRNSNSSRRSLSPASIRSVRSSRRRVSASTTSRWARPSSMSTTRWLPKARCAHRRASSPCRVTASASGATAATMSARNTKLPGNLRAVRFSASRLMSAKTSMSTSRRQQRRRLPSSRLTFLGWRLDVGSLGQTHKWMVASFGQGDVQPQPDLGR
jgi:Sulfatase